MLAQARLRKFIHTLDKWLSSSRPLHYSTGILSVAMYVRRKTFSLWLSTAVINLFTCYLNSFCDHFNVYLIYNVLFFII